MITKLISGGQTGADQGGLRAARAHGIETGGWAPRGWETEDGPAPWLGTDFGLMECEAAGYAVRTTRNADECHAALIFGDLSSPGSRCLIKACTRLGKPWVHVEPGARPSRIVTWLRECPYVTCILVAGNRESASPGIGGRVERFMGAVFRGMGGGV